jgi:catechol 2,3-dioxygenase-like lactoylglutathione lyase family enzyme
MIGVRKISHASYETPDLDKQAEYYVDVLGLALVAKERDAVYLANTIEHHSVILRRGSHSQCTRIGFQLGPDDDLDAFEKQTAAHGLKTSRKKDAEPTIGDMVAFEDPKGTVMEVFKRPEPQTPGFRSTGIVPHKLGHVAFHVTEVKAVTRFYCDVLGSGYPTGWAITSRSCDAARTITRSIWSRPARTSIFTRHSSCATGRICRAPAIS